MLTLTLQRAPCSLHRHGNISSSSSHSTRGSLVASMKSRSALHPLESAAAAVVMVVLVSRICHQLLVKVCGRSSRRERYHLGLLVMPPLQLEINRLAPQYQHSQLATSRGRQGSRCCCFYCCCCCCMDWTKQFLQRAIPFTNSTSMSSHRFINAS